MSSPFDEDILTSHSFDGDTRKMTQEGTLLSPPVPVHRIKVDGREGNYVLYDDHLRVVDELTAEIARLRKESEDSKKNMVTKEDVQELFAHLVPQAIPPKEPTERPEKRSHYDVHFGSNINVPAWTQELIALSGKMNDNKKKGWIINSLKSWGIVYKILTDKNIFYGNATDFCDYLLSEVFPNVSDENRKQALLKLKPSNLNHLSAEIKGKKIYEWNNEYQKNRKQKKYEECVTILQEMNRIADKIKKIS